MVQMIPGSLQPAPGMPARSGRALQEPASPGLQASLNACVPPRPLPPRALIRTQAAGGNIKYFKIYRWDPEAEGQKPYLATYAVNMDE
jgi:hypothetical protein